MAIRIINTILMCIVSVLLLGIENYSYAANRIFYENCESTSFSEYFLEDHYGTGYPTYWSELTTELTRSSINNSGSYSMVYNPWLSDNPHAVVGAGSLTYGNKSNFDISDYSSRYWYFRWFQRWESGVSYSGENKLLYINYKNAGDFVFTLKKSGGTSSHITIKDREDYGIVHNPYPDYSGGDLDDEQWHKMEVFIDVGTTGNYNGSYWVNIDDIELSSNSGMRYNVTINSNPIALIPGWPSNTSSATGSQRTWLDDLEIWTTDGLNDIPGITSCAALLAPQVMLQMK